jgi:hypothetical protein
MGGSKNGRYFSAERKLMHDDGSARERDRASNTDFPAHAHFCNWHGTTRCHTRLDKL